MTASKNLKRALLASTLLLTLVIISITTWIFKLDRSIQERFAQKRFGSPVEFYSAPEMIHPGSTIPFAYFQSFFTRHQFVQRDFGKRLNVEANADGTFPGTYSLWTGDECRTLIPAPPGAEKITRCLAYMNSERPRSSGGPRTEVPQIIAFSDGDQIFATFTGDPPQVAMAAALEPELFAQYYGDKPVLRTYVTLSEAPNNCINALRAIEDASYWDHVGISFTGLARALYRNVIKRRVSQGGSTLTQQLVKNYFLTDERTIKRKVTEFVMAILVEAHISKEDILETYINLIYMGANGPFQIRGFGAASEHYFGSRFADLNLEQCALLAAIVNSPGLFNPFTKPENALKRRSLVLNRMADLKFIDRSESERAKAAPLPERPPRSLSEPAPYFVQAVRHQLNEKAIDESDGLRVFTSLNLRAQEAAYQAVRNGIEHLEKTYPHIQKLKAAGKNLEAVLLSSDPLTGQVQAVVGGRSFQLSQFNRATDSHRQVGSIMKPFVFLTALESLSPDGKPYTPVSILKDAPFTHKYQGQTWSPHNFDEKYFGDIPMYFALKESLNAATASLGLSVGLNGIIDTARRMGVNSKIDPLPALTLGAFELYPWEVLQAYGTISRFGSLVPLTYLIRVEKLNGDPLFQYTPEAQQVVAPETTAELIGMMKQTIISGSGRGARLAGFIHPAAGKTGTTNDKKDAWFAGFTPYHSAVVWVGYDDNTPHNLTGGLGAVPIWTAYMKAYGASFPLEDFKWPEGTEVASLGEAQLSALGVPSKGKTPLEPVQLVFRKGQIPPGASPLSLVPTPPPTSTPGSF